MTSAIVLSPAQFEALEAGWLWLPAERVEVDRRWVSEDRPREDGWRRLAIRKFWGYPGMAPDIVEVRERLVSPSIPDTLLPKTCERCHGWKHIDNHPVCPSCGGSGVTAEPWYAGVEQWRPDWGTEWNTTPPTVGKWNDERRVALLARVRLTGQPIPVEQRLDDDLWVSLGEWRQGLAVGDLLAPVAVTMLDQPVVDHPTNDLRCQRCGASASLPLGMSCSDHRPERIRVPLSLVPGTWGTL